MKLADLMRDVPYLKTNVNLETEITEIVYDSRKVTSGSLFVAVAGFVTDGNKYIPMALEKGAVAVVTATQPSEEVPYILVESDRLALAQLGSAYYGHPSKAMQVIGITGTNGKTTSTLLLKHILEKTFGAKVGLVGTMENLIGDEVVPTERTTPESLDLQALFGKMRDAGCSHVIMEVSSHALELERVGGVEFTVGAFTNLTEDHLDFHKTMENYCDAKAMLFARSQKCLANVDDRWFDRMCSKAKTPVMTVSAKNAAELYATDAQLHSDGVSFVANYAGQKQLIQLPIPGGFTVYNALTAIGCALQLGLELEDIAKALTSAQGVKGRVEVVPTPGKPYTILIDYAHTPDGLENVLSSVKGYCKGRLIAVFGCGGDRDPIKRPIMGRIGAEIADIAIITSDNPRTEEPMSIIRDILAGLEGKNNYQVIENRPQAIRHAMDIAEKDDIIVLAGKGHETYQEINGVKHHLDEREVVCQYLEEMRS